MALSTSTEELVFAVLRDGSEVFGRAAFPFRRNLEQGVACSVGDQRLVLRESECRILQVLRPEELATLPSGELWESANHDPLIRDAIKERCNL